MKWLKSVVFRSKIFWGYLFLFCGILIFIISFAGMVWTRNVIKERQEQEKQQLYEKICTIAQDFEEQLVNMRKVVLTSTSCNEFRDYSQKENSYYKIDIIEKMESNAEIVNITKECFFICADRNEMLSSVFGALPVSLYSKIRFSEEEEQLIEDILWESCNSEKRTIVEYSNNDIMVLFPFSNIYSLKGSQKNGVFGFVISKSDFEKRILKLVGKLNGSLSIQYDGSYIYGKESIEKETSEDESSQADFELSENLEIIRTINGQFLYEIMPETNHAFPIFFSARGLVGNVILFTLGFGIAFGLAILMTWPINRIGKQIGISSNENDWYNWKAIEMKLEKILISNEKFGEKKFHALRQQTIGMIVSGKYTNQFQRFVLFFNIKTDFLLYGVISCGFLNKEQDSDVDVHILQQIEALTENDMALYPCWESDRVLKILVGVEENSQFNVVMDRLKHLFDVLQLEVVLELFEQGTSLDTLKGVRVSDYEQKNKMMSDEINLSKLMQDATQYLEQHYMDFNLSLESVAEILEITPAYLSRIIKKETGITYKEYVTNLKLEKAKELLKQKDITVAMVCEKIGYTNVSYFIKLFKNYTGETPAKWRENWENEHKSIN